MAPPQSLRTVRPLLRQDDLLADRYRLDHPVEPAPRASEVEESPAVLWRATDEVLARPVAVKLLRAAGRRGGTQARPFLEAAAATGTLSSPVLARVYDAAVQQWPAERSGRPAGDVDVAYVISEWVEGRDLATVLQQDGPFEPEQAGALIVEVAEALHAAHRRDVVHGRVHPGNLLLTRSGRPRLTDVATSAALPDRAVPAERAGDPVGPAADVRDLTAVLYAMLTARWPVSTTPQPSCGLPAAPAVNDGRSRGRLTSPGQIRAGIPRALDDLVVRVLQPTPGRPAPATAAALADAVAAAAAAAARPVGAARAIDAARAIGAARAAGAARAVSTVGAAGASGPLRAAQAVAARPPPAAPRVPPDVWRFLPLIASLVLILTVGLGMYAVGRAVGEIEPADEAAEVVAGGPGTTRIALDSARVRVFNPPPGRGNERMGAVPNAYDDDPTTVWETERYASRRFGGLKPGVGLLVDLGEPTPVTQVELVTTGGDATFELRAADDLGAQAGNYRVLARGTAADPALTLTPPEGTTARWYLVWVTGLRKTDGGFTAGIAEMHFLRG
ncbi:MAG: protein kinase [Mycobacteriales bacterium]